MPRSPSRVLPCRLIPLCTVRNVYFALFFFCNLFHLAVALCEAPVCLNTNNLSSASIPQPRHIVPHPCCPLYLTYAVGSEPARCRNRHNEASAVSFACAALPVSSVALVPADCASMVGLRSSSSVSFLVCLLLSRLQLLIMSGRTWQFMRLYGLVVPEVPACVAGLGASSNQKPSVFS